MSTGADYVLVRGVVYERCREFLRRGGFGYVWIRTSIPPTWPDDPAKSARTWRARYPEDRLPKHEVITAETAQRIKAESRAAWVERLRVMSGKAADRG